MEKHPPLPMTPFDILTSSTQLQMMKLMLPYTPPNIQRMLAFYIKFLELQKTIEYFGLFGKGSGRDSFSKTPGSITDILEDLRPYLGKDAETVDMMLSAMSMMDMMKDMDMPDLSGAGMDDISGVMQMMNAFGNSQDTGNEPPDHPEPGRHQNRQEYTDTSPLYDEQAEDGNKLLQKGDDEDGTGLAEPPGDGEY